MAKLEIRPTDFDSATKALNGRSSRRIGNNTELRKTSCGNVVATLHGHEIVEWTPEGTYATWAGYATSTTRDRLNQLAPGRFNIKDREPRYNGLPVSSREWIRVD
jgi:hypothetical protein